MSEKHLVCQGATCQCQFGKAPDNLKVLTQTKRFVNDAKGAKKLIASNKDLGQTFEKNTFGSCAKLNNGPCQVAVVEWKSFYEKITLAENSGNPLLEDSKAVCAISGSPSIEIIKHGQTAEVTQQNIENAEPEAIAELCPVLNLQDEDEISQLPILL